MLFASCGYSTLEYFFQLKPQITLIVYCIIYLVAFSFLIDSNPLLQCAVLP